MRNDAFIAGLLVGIVLGCLAVVLGALYEASKRDLT